MESMEEEVHTTKGVMGLDKSEESLKLAVEEDSMNESHHEEDHLQSFVLPDAEPRIKSFCNKEPLLQPLVIPDHSQPLPVKGDNLNQVAMKTVEADASRTKSVSAKTKKAANTLTFRCCHGQHRPVKIWLRGRKLMAALTAKKIRVTAINVNFMRRLPTGSNDHVISSCFLSLVQQCPRTNHCQHTNIAKHRVLEPDVRKLDGSKWLEVERNRLSQRSGSSTTCIQKKFTDELDSSVAMDTDMEQHDTSHLLSTETNSENNRTVGHNEIDDIFCALDGMS